MKSQKAPDTAAPTVRSVAFTSATGIQNSTLNAGDVIRATVTLSEAVTVTGTPQLALKVGSATVRANYVSGSGTTALVFDYTIRAGQTDLDGIAIGANALTLNGGGLKDAAGNNAKLSHTAVAANASYKVDTTAPTPNFTSATDNVGSVQGTLHSGATTDDTALALAGTCEAGSTVNVYNGATLAGAATVSGTRWTYSAVVANGTTYQFNVKETDATGNVSAATARFAVTGATTSAIAPASNTPVKLEAIGRSDGDDKDPQIAAVGTAGEYVVVWVGEDSEDDESVFVQQFNADGTTKGNSPVQLDGFVDGRSRDRSPQVTAVGTSGAYVVTWVDDQVLGEEDRESVFAQKFNADGMITGEPVRIKAAHSASPQITAVGSSGAYVLTWSAYVGGRGNEVVFVQKVNADGTTTGNPLVQLEGYKTDSAIHNTDRYPQITAVGTAGEYVVTWEGSDSTTHDLPGYGHDRSIFVQKFNADGTTTGNARVQLEAINNTKGSDQHPRITAAGTAGEYVVIWEGEETYGSSQTKIFVQKFNADGTITGNTPVKLGSYGQGSESPGQQITAVGTTGEYVVAWSGWLPNKNGEQVFVQKFNANGTTTGNRQIPLNGIANNQGGDDLPQITAVGSSGEYVVTWVGGEKDGLNNDKEESIFVQKFNANGTTTGHTPTRLEASVNNREGSDLDSDPQIAAVGTSGAYVVTWQGKDDNGDRDYSIFVQQFNADGTTGGGATGPTASADNKTGGGTTGPAASADNTTGGGAIVGTVRADSITGRGIVAPDQPSAGQAVIDLGSYGKLIHPVQVDGKWYYHWDRSGDGSSGSADTTSHDVLDGIFRYASDFTTMDSDGNTDDTFRYATLNGVKVALPTLGTEWAGMQFLSGTAIDNSPVGETNPSYDDLLAIWDAYNGSGTRPFGSGTPSGWQADYWSATPSAEADHAVIDMDSGWVRGTDDRLNSLRFVALQVL